MRKIAKYDRAGGTVDRLDPAEHGCAQQRTTDDGEDQCAERRPGKGIDDQPADLDPILHVATHQQTIPARQLKKRHSGHMQVAVAYQIDLVPTGRGSDGERPGL